MPVDRGSIDAQLKEIGEGERWWDQREFRDLPHVLDAGERMLGLITGTVLGSRRPRILPAPWLLVATTQRLICLKQERFGRKQLEFRLGQVTGMQHRSRMRTYQITLQTPQRTYRIRIAKADAFRFIRALAPLMPEPPAQLPPAGRAGEPLLAGARQGGISGLVSGRAMLPAPEYAARSELERVQAHVEQLEREVERLRSQVEFMEKLLEDRGDGMMSLPGSSADS